VSAQGTRLERARRRVDSGDYKSALKDLWYAEAQHRVDGPRLQEALSLARALVAKTGGGARSEAETLVSVLSSDLERAGLSPLEGAATEAPLDGVAIEAQANPPFGVVASCTAIVAIVLFLVGVALVADNILVDSTQGDIGSALVLISLASALVSLGAAIAWAVTALRRHPGARPATPAPNGEVQPRPLAHPEHPAWLPPLAPGERYYSPSYIERTRKPRSSADQSMEGHEGTDGDRN
jgi:hypothetical protein